MHVLMLGWEFPPYITGGLGTACYGLTKALDRLEVRITFVLPQSPDSPGPQSSPGSSEPHSSRESSHVRLLSPDMARVDTRIATSFQDESFPGVQFIGLPAEFSSPYPGHGPVIQAGSKQESTLEIPSDIPLAASSSQRECLAPSSPAPHPAGHDSSMPSSTGDATGEDYGGDIVDQAERYAHHVLRLVAGSTPLDFDVIHAHDWMTFPAGLSLARITGKPLVVHVHSTEFDRSGVNVNQRIYDIERRGMHGAFRVITVSQLTANTVIHRYGVPEHHLQVVYNGVEFPDEHNSMRGIRREEKIVLYFGRITHQKGPEYFIRAAKRVLEHLDNVKFVVAGSGDMARHMIEMAANLGIGNRVLFTGFLRGDDIKRVFSLADLYVMPSVSEPFGIAPLEAMSHDVPVLISKSSGVSEVISHALKVDFWDIEDMADKIIAVLRHPTLSQTLQQHGSFEVRRLTWDGAAKKCEQIYREVTAEMGIRVNGD